MPVKRHLTAEQRRERTVETVIELCGQEEPATITTGEIARQMGVTQGALFRHFPSKDAIWEAVVDWVGKRVMQRLDAAAAGAGAPLEALEAMFMAHVEFIAEHPGVPRLLLGQLQHARPTPARRMVRSLLFLYRERVEGLLLRAREAGQLRAGLDLEAAALQFIGSIQGLVIQSLMAGEVGRILDQAPGVFAIYRHGIAADGEEHP
ncbi:TetR/AcrR family transcriptional regulator [Halomonas sp. C05BenzN]|uniref:TetR/AcrR family transcriptional regulator n=1 Tax=Halomonas sp. C05BenzN TaxID=3411041 RepID=UPI003B9427B7